MHRNTLVVGFVGLLASISNAQNPPYVFTPIVIDTAHQMTFSSPVINNNGKIAYNATKAGLGTAIVAGADFEADAVVSDFGNGPYSSIGPSFVMNDNGDIVFTGKVRE